MSNVVDDALLDLSNYPNHLTLDTQYGDMDVSQHINNVAIMKYYENVRSRYLMALLGGKKQLLSDEYAFVIVESTVKYLAEMHFPDPVTIGTAIYQIGNRSITTQQAAFQLGKCVGLCHTVMVMVSQGKSTPFSDSLRVRLQAEHDTAQGLL